MPSKAGPFVSVHPQESLKIPKQGHRTQAVGIWRVHKYVPIAFQKTILARIDACQCITDTLFGDLAAAEKAESDAIAAYEEASLAARQIVLKSRMSERDFARKHKQKGCADVGS
eukprot:1681986-Amphidinium_carterae.1